MKITTIACFVLCFTAATQFVKADSPLTSTFFAGNYPEYPLIEKALFDRTLTKEAAEFLMDKKAAIDAKAALINAIGWSYDGTKNAEVFREFLAAKYKTTTASLQLSQLSADELMCLGYFKAMDDYFIVDDAINILEMASEKKPTSFTIHMVLNLVRAQKAMDTDFCKVWTLTADVLNNKSLKRDMKTSSVQNIVDYMLLYKEDCYY